MLSYSVVARLRGVTTLIFLNINILYKYNPDEYFAFRGSAQSLI